MTSPRRPDFFLPPLLARPHAPPRSSPAGARPWPALRSSPTRRPSSSSPGRSPPRLVAAARLPPPPRPRPRRPCLRDVARGLRGGRLVRARRSKVQWPASHVASLANPAVRPPGPASRSQRSLQRCTPQPQITPQVRFDLGTSLLPIVIRLGKFIDPLFY